MSAINFGEGLIDGIPKRHMNVLNNMLNGMSNGDAYMAEYRSVKKPATASAAATRLLKNVKCAEYIKLRKQEASQNAADRLGITEERILSELALLAFGNIQDLYDENGNLIPISKLPRDVAASIQSTKARRERNRNPRDDEDDTETDILEVKVYDKRLSLVDLGKARGDMFKDKVELGTDRPFADIMQRIAESRKGASPLPSGE